MSRRSPSFRFGGPLTLVLLVHAFAACGSGESSPGNATGGSVGQATGGASTGGTLATGGTISTGGTVSTGGTPSAGKSGSGGATGTGGSSAAGKTGAGGAVGTGGSAGAGGAPNVGAGGTSGGSAGNATMAGNGGGAGKSSGGASGSAGSATAGGGSGGGAAGGPGGGKLTLTSPAFEHVEGCAKATPMPCDVFPNENLFYMQNMNVSPEMSWTGVPTGTKSFAIVLQDVTINAAHWVLWNIPASVTMVAANIPKDTAMPAMPAGSQQCSATFGQGDGYLGPGSACNVYEFVLYALSVEKFTPSNATDAAQVRTQLQGLGEQVIATANLRGRSNYNMMCSN